MAEQPHRLDVRRCHEKATECRSMADNHHEPSHKIMLRHMAETWERIAETFGKGKSQRP